MRTTALKPWILKFLGSFLIISCAKTVETKISGPDSGSPQALGGSKGDGDSKEIGKALIQRLITSSTEESIWSDNCLITEKAVTFIRSKYNIKTDENDVKVYQKFQDLSRQDLKDSISRAAAAPKVVDEQAKSESSTMTVYIMDPKDADTVGYHVLISVNANGLERRDSAESATLIAETDRLCADALISQPAQK
jgi:hypothetical protein